MHSSAPSLNSQHTEGEFGLELFVRTWISRWRVIVFSAFLGLLLGALNFWIAAPSYSATLSLVPASSSLQSGPDSAIGGIASTLSGFGVQLPQASSQSDFILFPRVIAANEVAGQVLKRRDILKRIFPNEYDAATDSFRAPPGLYSAVKATLFSMVGQPGYIPPTLRRVQSYIGSRVTINEATTTFPITRLAYDNEDPAFAREFIQLLYQATDGQLRTWRVVRAQESSEYLENKLNTVSAVDYRAGLLNQLIPQQMTVMLANPKLPFAARIIDGPSTPDRPDSPKVLGYLMMGLFAGLGLSMGLLALRCVLPAVFRFFRAQSAG